uniref:Ras association domain family member 9 n=2 Tax=Latimeria chalumnae TaxID=7897 RepID=H3AV66_LATCH
SKEMGSGQKEIVVWVYQEEKVVCGLTKYTTCIDVIQALLEEHQATSGTKSHLLGHPKEYCIVEKWRDFERILLPQTKILRLWKSWGEEQPNLQFVLVKANEFLPIPEQSVADAKVVQNTERQCDLSPAQYIKSLPVDKQKRIVRKAFRKLAKMKKGTFLSEDDSMKTLINLILSQDHTIHQQIQRMRELDMEIEKYEAMLYLKQAEPGGEIFVQDTYLFEGVEFASGQNKCEKQSVYQVEDFLIKSEEILQLEEQLKHQKELIGKLSADIEREVINISLQSQEGNTLIDCRHTDTNPDSFSEPNIESMKCQLEKSMHTGLRVHIHLNDVQKELKYNDIILQRKAKEYEHLAAQLSSMHLIGNNTHGHSVLNNEPTKGNALTSSITGFFNLAKMVPGGDMNDTDSDTGISSTHSQDSETSCVNRTLLST